MSNHSKNKRFGSEKSFERIGKARPVGMDALERTERRRAQNSPRPLPDEDDDDFFFSPTTTDVEQIPTTSEN